MCNETAQKKRKRKEKNRKEKKRETIQSNLMQPDAMKSLDEANTLMRKIVILVDDYWLLRFVSIIESSCKSPNVCPAANGASVLANKKGMILITQESKQLYNGRKLKKAGVEIAYHTLR